MPSSFRRDRHRIPPRYRTPSPPRHAFEPLSPVLQPESATSEASGLQWADNAGVRNSLRRPHFTQQEHLDGSVGICQGSGGAMDAFASIALATKSSLSFQPITSTADSQFVHGYHGERHPKRARSEKLPSPDWPRKKASADSRPATSYKQSPGDRRLGAELLLNFAQEAAKLVSPSPVLCHANLTHSRRSSESTDCGRSDEDNCVRKPDDQQHVSRDSGKSAAIIREHVQVSKATRDDNHEKAEDNSKQPTVILPPIPTEIIEVYPDDSEINGTCRRAVTIEISKDDHVDLIPDTSGPEQGAATGQTESPFNADAQKDFDVSTPAVSPRTDVRSDELRARRTQLQAPMNATLSLDNTLQSLDDAGRIEEGDAKLKGEPVEETCPEIEQLPEEDVENQSSAIHDAFGYNGHAVNGKLTMALENPVSTAPEPNRPILSGISESTPDDQNQLKVATAVCAACSLTRNRSETETENNSTSWISCDACKSWFHFACAGFKNEREVRGIDKFRCRKCKPIHGSTTYVRKSSRAHSAIDYAGLHQGVIKTSDERPEHHYIKPIREGTVTFTPENFPRMRPELVTAEYFEKGIGMKEPVVIPACFNPRSDGSAGSDTQSKGQHEEAAPSSSIENDDATDEWFIHYPESEIVPDHGQDALDMVIPQGLTVRQVAELYGPDEKVEVIDVKSQNGENKKWNMRRWADYYENPNNKVVRNVISLEVSQSKLGRLIRRPQIVRELDLQDSVWPQDLLAKGEYPRVQFYTLMSVADCFTDFHIDFGGSSVFYHILKGKKTFLFIPPKEKYLKKYEEWCMSPAQNWTFLGGQTKECYRVDLSEGDTMLIPSGWIHAVWTPEDSLVIGGNFLTRMNYGMQLRVAQVEKATGVARKFRYPHFQKLQWYTALRYLENDPLPDSVRHVLHAGGSFHREKAAYYDFDYWGENSRAGPENYHARYYSQSELEGLPDLTRYLLRTALIDIGGITDGISADTRNAVKKSIPRGHGEPLDLIRAFAAWCAWKRGNEPIPHWAYPGAVPENLSPDKLSIAAIKKLDREAALSAPRRQSARMQSQQGAASVEIRTPSFVSNASAHSELKRSSSVISTQGPAAGIPKRRRITSGVRTASHRKTACESCRKRRRACKHKDEVVSSMATPPISTISLAPLSLRMPAPSPASRPDAVSDDLPHKGVVDGISEAASVINDGVRVVPPDQTTSPQPQPQTHTLLQDQDSVSPSQNKTASHVASSDVPVIDLQVSGDAVTSPQTGPGYILQARPRHKACSECRKSKRRCIHDAFGNEDPIKVREIAIPRPHARKSKAQNRMDPKTKMGGSKQEAIHQPNIAHLGVVRNSPAMLEQVSRLAPIANMIAPQSSSNPAMDNSANLSDAAMQRKIAESASLLLDPALLLHDRSSFRYEERTVRHVTIPPNEQSEDFHKTALTQFPERSEVHFRVSSNVTDDKKARPAQLEQRDSFEQPASSLVSPPASSHDDVGNSPTVPNAQWTPSIFSSERFEEQPKQMQRYTPESGPIRRASSSPHSDNLMGKVAEPKLTGQPSGQNLTSRPDSIFVTDHESLLLIKELKAQELGLRRRVRA